MLFHDEELLDGLFEFVRLLDGGNVRRETVPILDRLGHEALCVGIARSGWPDVAHHMMVS